MTFAQTLGLIVPILQAPMAGVSTPAVAAAVSEAGGLGALGLGASSPAGVVQAIRETRALTARPFNVNFFYHSAPDETAPRNERWIGRLRPVFEAFRAEAPTRLMRIYPEFQNAPELMGILLAERLPVVSFHFGLPLASQVHALKAAEICLLATATSEAEALAAQWAGTGAQHTVAASAAGITTALRRDLADPKDRHVPTALEGSS